MDLLPHQSRNAGLLLKALATHGAAIDASDTGTGKTITAVALCREINALPAVVCPLNCVPAWQEACAALEVEPLFIANYEQCKTEPFPFGKLVRDPKGGVREYVWNLGDNPRVLPIFDEAQRCRNRSAQNSLMLLASARAHRTLLLSATPFTTPLEAYPIGRVLRLFNANTYQRWCFDHGVRFSRFSRAMEFRGGPEDMESIHREVFPCRGVRTRRSEIPNFPETLILPRTVELSEVDVTTRPYLEALARKTAADWEKARMALPEELREEAAPLQLTRDLRARQETELRKCALFAEMARDAADRGESVAIFVNFDDSINLLQEYLETDCILRGHRPGGPDNVIRARHIRAFQNNKSPWILVNVAAGGAGVSLHDAKTQRPRRALISPTWSAIVMKQVLGRSHRLGGGFSTQEVIFARGTAEERVYKRVQERLRNIDALCDGDLALASDNT